MKSFRLCAILCLLFSFAASMAHGSELEGLWLGYEPLGMPPEHKGDRWYYENQLTVKGETVELSKFPIVRNHGRVGYSASDGGFPVFKGRLLTKDSVPFALLEIQSCDYCINLPDGAKEGHIAYRVPNHGVHRQGEPKEYPIRISGKTIILDKIEFHRVEKFP
jgi:hypothetical protein